MTQEHSARYLLQALASTLDPRDCLDLGIWTGRVSDEDLIRVFLYPDKDDEDRLICSVACIASRGECGLRKPAAQPFAKLRSCLCSTARTHHLFSLRSSNLSAVSSRDLETC